MNLFFTESRVVLDDNPLKFLDIYEQEYFIFEQTRSDSYHEVAQDRENATLSDRTYAAIYLRADEITKNHIRRTYSLLEFLGDLGGIKEILFALFSYMIGFLIERKFNTKLVGDLYKVQSYSKDQSEYYETGIDNEGHIPTIPDLDSPE